MMFSRLEFLSAVRTYGEMNPFDWKPEHRVAFVFAAIFGACIGVFGGMGHFDPYTSHRWLWVALYGAVGTALGAAGGFLRQLLRGRISN
jgi:H+/Cl- antiporter ClcA